jgi:hypothetical protein
LSLNLKAGIGLPDFASGQEFVQNGKDLTPGGRANLPD